MGAEGVDSDGTLASVRKLARNLSQTWTKRTRKGFFLRADDACWFLDEKNQCKMHAHLGGPKKAIVCRSFPFSMADTPGGTFVSLRFNCPTVAAGGHGRALEEQRDEIEKLHRDYRDDRNEEVASGEDPLMLDDEGLEAEMVRLHADRKQLDARLKSLKARADSFRVRAERMLEATR